jgi:glycosyltransferase involved in cell wall biosynthesis
VRVNIITVQSGWILQKIAERITEAGNNLGHHFELSHGPAFSSRPFDARFYVDVQNCYWGKTDSLDIGLFTHLHENSLANLDNRWLSLDHIIHMCERYKHQFQSVYPSERMSVMPPGQIDPAFKIKKPIVGIVQRGRYVGKGFDFMESLAHLPVMQNFEWRFIGNDWGPVVEIFRAYDVEVYSNSDDGLIYPDGYAGAYNQLDYLLIPSLWEGGPMSVIEAKACGLPIISADVGWAPEMNVDYIFEPGNIKELESILKSIISPILRRRAEVESLSYERYVLHLFNVVSRLENQRV